MHGEHYIATKEGKFIRNINQMEIDQFGHADSKDSLKSLLPPIPIGHCS